MQNRGRAALPEPALSLPKGPRNPFAVSRALAPEALTANIRDGSWQGSHALLVRFLMRNVVAPVPIAIQPAVTPLALLVLGDPLDQVRPAEIRPQDRRHINLGVSQLPQQKITQPHLAAGANHQVRIRQMAGVKMPPDHLLIDL